MIRSGMRVTTRSDTRSNRPAIEIADILRRHGDAYRRVHAGHLGRVERRVMSAIVACRTEALGGHMEACDDCGTTRVAYNSCLMGKSINGELACRHRHFSVNCSDLCLHNSAVLRLHRLGH
jgi:Transposase zinc-binding domain